MTVLHNPPATHSATAAVKIKQEDGRKGRRILILALTPPLQELQRRTTIARATPRRPGVFLLDHILPSPVFMFHDIAGHEDLTEGIIGCGIRVHEALGPGLLESVYRSCMLIELNASGYQIDTTRRVPLIYRGQDVGATFCPDLIVNDTVVVELKAVDRFAPVHKTQLITYLKLTGLPVGLLMNFHVDWLKNGTRRIVRPDLYVKRPISENPK